MLGSQETSIETQTGGDIRVKEFSVLEWVLTACVAFSLVQFFFVITCHDILTFTSLTIRTLSQFSVSVA